MSEETASIETELACVGARFTPLELRLPDALPKDEWIRLGVRLHRSGQVINWWIGDWATFGERKKYGDLKEFADLNDLDYGYLANMVYVSSRVEVSRRCESLPWSFHQVIAPLKPKEQSIWLKKAVEEHLPRALLRRQIRVSNGESSALESEGDTLKSGTKLYDDFLDWLRKRPADFWTSGRCIIWKERIEVVSEFARAL